MNDAYFVDPICFSFSNPVTKKKKYLFIHVDHMLPFYERIGIVKKLALERLAPEINGVHEELMMNYLADNGFFRADIAGEVNPDWVLPHLVKCLPTRQGNGVVWEGTHPDTNHYWKRT